MKKRIWMSSAGAVALMLSGCEDSPMTSGGPDQNFLVGLCEVGGNGAPESDAAVAVVADCSLDEFQNYDAVLVGQKFMPNNMSMVLSTNLSEIPESERLFQVIDVNAEYDIKQDGTVLVTLITDNGCRLRTLYKNDKEQYSKYTLPFEGSCDEMQKQLNINSLNVQDERGNVFEKVRMIKI